MFCPKCGVQKADDALICANCGNKFKVENEPQQQNPQPQQYQTPQPPQNQFQPPYQQAPITPETKIKPNIGLIIKIIAVVLAILFFVPMFTVSCSGGFGKISFSGLDCTIGKSINVGFGVSERTESYLHAGLLLLLPIILFITFLSKSKSAYIAGLILSIVGLILFFMFYSEVNRILVAENSDGMYSLKFSPAFYFSMILYVISGILCMVGVSEKRRL